MPRRKVVVEVKEISPNREERQAWQDIKKGKFTVVSATPGERVRHKISNAVPQIKARSKGRFPSLLVLMDTGFAAEHTSPYNVRVAMYGFETLVLAVPSNPARRPYLTDKKFGGSRKMTPSSNTSVSAVAVIGKLNGNLDFRAYHNEYAAIPLPTAMLRQYAIPQFVLAAKQLGAVQGWVQV
jgi:hypothetical protein